MTVQRPHILAIDDTPDNLLTLGAILSSEFDLQLATSGAMGLEQAGTHLPDLILLDIMMPEMDGYETCRRLKADPVTCNVPVIFLTALNSVEDETRGLESGAVDFISKPVNPAVVRARVRTHIGIKRIENELRLREERLNLAINGVNDGIWDWDLGTNALYLSPKWKEMIGFRDDELANEFASFESRLHPDDAGRVFQAIKQYLDGHAAAFQTEFRMRHKDGSWRWVLGRGEAQRDAEGRSYRMLGSHTDITVRKQMETALHMSEARFRTMIEAAHDGILLADIEAKRFVDANPTICAMTGYSRDELLAMPIEHIHPVESRPIVMDIFSRQARDEMGEAHDVPVQRKDGSLFHADVGVSRMELDGRKYMAGFFRDITERKRAEEGLRLAANVFTHAREGILITDRNANIINVNQAFTYITGYSREEVLGRNPRMFSSGQQGKEFYSAMWQDLLAKGHWYGEVWNRRKDGAVYAEMLTISSVRDDQGEIQNYMALFADITALKEHESQLERIAHYDVLTGLPNRVLLADRLIQAMTQTRRRNQRLAVAYLDLDGFKAVNDTYGHEVGDQLLATVANRMKQVLRDGDTISRIGGDEFVAVLLDLSDIDASVPMLSRLLAAAAQPVHVGEIVLNVSASLGVTFYPHIEEVDADQLLRQADQAMYQAKVAGKNRYHIFDAEQDRSVRGHHESLERIRQALADREFVLYYQPKVNMRTGRIVGAEGLIRWRHPQRGLLPPAVFLPVIEDHPLAIDLGEWVIETALAQIEAWHSVGLLLPVSVNVGARQLQHTDFVARLRTLLARNPGVAPGELELEVLETSALKDVTQVSQVMRACQDLGVSFALDDFGTGYSSLTYLKRLPARLLKIDQSFVRGMLDDPEDLAILEGVLGLATAFRRDAIAEGVETLAHGEMLLQLGCEHAQGYSIAHPMPAEQIQEWASSWQPGAMWLNKALASRDDLTVLYATVELRAWVMAVENNLKGLSPELPPNNPHQCRFGLWLESAQAEGLLTQPVFARLDERHQQIHALVEALLNLKEQEGGAPALARLGEVHVLVQELLEYLKELCHLAHRVGVILPGSDPDDITP